MKTEITEIWIESEHTEGPMIGGKEITDDNVDVIVTFSDGRRFVGSFFTYDNIMTLTEKNGRTGELLSGKYFWASELILIDRVDRKSVEAVIEDLIKEGYFDTAFKEVTQTHDSRQSVGEAIVIDFAKYMNKILEFTDAYLKPKPCSNTNRYQAFFDTL